MKHGILGGIRPADIRNAALAQPIQPLPPPQVVLPMPLLDGVPCRPGVRAGDYVTVGQKLADSDTGLAVHAPVAGRVSAIGPRVQPCGTSVLSVVIDNDLSDVLCPSVRPPANPAGLSPRQMLSLIRSAGAADADGTPAHTKIASGMGRVNTVIINACESEPYIAVNCRLTLERPADILGGAKVLAKLYSVDRVHIVLESGKREAAQLLRAKIEEEKAPAVVDALPIRYPQNLEKPLCRAITGRRILPGASTAAAGCAVFGVSAAIALYDAVYRGKPVTDRVITVSGSGVRQPKNLLCPIGTPIRYLLDACGGVDPKTYKILLGGPMTGLAQYDMDAPVGKTDSAVLALCANEDRASAHPHCIRCGRCISVCPMDLRPVVMYRYEQAGQLGELRRAHLPDCIECGACTYVCPGRVPLLQAFRTGKQKLAGGKEAL